MHQTLLVLLLSLTPKAKAQDPYDPKSYLQSRDFSQVDQLKEGEVLVKGVKYRVYTSAAGALFIPVLDKVTGADLERSLCANQMPVLLEKCMRDDPACMERNRAKVASEVTIVRAETPLSENVKAYAEIIGTTIKKKCGDIMPAYGLSWIRRPEFGIEYKDTHKRDPSSYKIYVPALGPSLGFKSEF